MLYPPDSRLEEGLEISPRFRRTLEERIARLDRDAQQDHEQLAWLENPDHIRRHRRLIAAECAEALRLRIFLERSRTRAESTVNSGQ